MKDYSKEAIEILSETFKELYPKKPWDSNDEQFIKHLESMGCGPNVINTIFRSHADSNDLSFDFIQNNIKVNLKNSLQRKPYVSYKAKIK
jgi:hypothetical protein